MNAMNPNQIDKVDTVRMNQHQLFSNAFEWEPASVMDEVSPASARKKKKSSVVVNAVSWSDHS